MTRGASPIEFAIMSEKADSLRIAEAAVVRGLARLAAAADAPDRPALVQQAADAAHAYFIQRELCGFRDREDVVRDLAIPREVIVRIGAR